MDATHGALDPCTVILDSIPRNNHCSPPGVDFGKFVADVVSKLLAEVPSRSGSYVAEEHARQLKQLQLENFQVQQRLASKLECSGHSDIRSLTVVDIDQRKTVMMSSASEDFQCYDAEDGLNATQQVEYSKASFSGELCRDAFAEGVSDNSLQNKLSSSRLPLAQGHHRYELLREWKAEDGETTGPISTYTTEEDTLDSEAVVQEHFAKQGLLMNKEAHPMWVFSPNSRPRLVWDLLGTLLLGSDLILIPLGVFKIPKHVALTTVSWVTLLFWSADIFASFITGYFEGSSMIMTPRRIARHYLRTWFCLDIFILAIDWTGTIHGDSSGDASGIMRAGKLLRILRILRTLRLLRLAKLRSLMRQVQDHLDSDYLTIFMGMLKNILLIIAINHFIACAWFGIGDSGKQDSWVEFYGFDLDHDNTTVAYQYATSLHWSLTQFTPASMSVQPQNLLERTFAVIVLLFALIVFGSFLSSITSSMTNLRNINAKRDQQFFMLRKFLRQNNISEDLQYRINRYVQVMYEHFAKRIEQKQIELLTVLSNPLIKELQGELYHPKLTVHPLFKRLYIVNQSIVHSLCSSAVRLHGLSKDDTLFRGGDQATEMYFLTRGFMVYQRTVRGHRRETSLLKENDYCSEAVLWTKWFHQGNLQASIECDVLGIHANSFREVILSNPVHSHFQRKYGAAFVRALNEKLEQSKHCGIALSQSGEVLDSTGFLSDLQAQLIDIGGDLHRLLVERSASKLPESQEEGHTNWPHLSSLMDSLSIKVS